MACEEVFPTKETAKKKRVEPPVDWKHCCFFVERKQRFCRLDPKTGSRFCGEHRRNDASRKRVPCPLDPTHTVYEDMISKHLKKCPKAKELRQQEQLPSFRRNCNCGGHGSLGKSLPAADRTLEWAKRVARAVLRTHQKVFCNETIDSVESIPFSAILGAIPTQDGSDQEYRAGFLQAMEAYEVKSGGARHLHQQASLIALLRQIRALPHLQHDKPERASRGTSDLKNQKQRIILEMGAGRGMAGLAVAGVSATTDPTKLIMVERAGSRNQAEKFIRATQRRAQQKATFLPSETCMDISKLEFERIKSDLAHVDMGIALTASDRDELVVVAKHLCGAGTDLAVKSLEPIAEKISACVLATCCHGVCDWGQYVGRDYLRSAILEHGFAHGVADDKLCEFGEAEFELLRHWSAGSALSEDFAVESERSRKARKVENGDGSVHRAKATGSCPVEMRVSNVVSEMKLACGVNGLGRACQRLIDYGRQIYIDRMLFKNGSHDDDPLLSTTIVHYVSPEVTVMNAALVGTRVN